MAIIWDEKEQVFYLHTEHTTYAMGLQGGALLSHMYWGPRVRKLPNAGRFQPFVGRAATANDAWLPDRLSSEAIQLEYGVEGGVDHRHPAAEAVCQGRSALAELKYQSHRIVPGKPALPGLPSTYTEQDGEAETLQIVLSDAISGMAVTLSYSIYPARDVLTRSAVFHNDGKKPVQLRRALSACVDFEEGDFELLHLPGAWARERHVERTPLFRGDLLLSSARGASSHAENPFFALVRKNTDENSGDCYGFNLVYSGEFEGGAEKNHLGNCRAYLGINPRHFDWMLEPGGGFQTPEAVLVYSGAGLGGMSRIYHDLYRSRLCRGKFRDAPRPVLINNWEATYFDFNEEKILRIAQTAKEIGVELMVLDDGWFGKRNDDHTSLGDWTVDRNKLPDGIGALSEKVEKIGMRFGLWFEPEMVSPDSELHRAHPDWHIHIPGYGASLGRHQWILDLSRREIQDYVIQAVSGVLRSARISYVKWDMNRNMAELGSAALPGERTGELCHRYILGLYRILEELTAAFPDVLFESCSGGGGRFDPGMLYYMPQVWTSDCSDGAERLFIQYGTSMAYPACTMGAHVSAVPNHQVGRTTPLKLRGEAAMMGQFGFELDLAKLPAEELEEARAQIARYKEIRGTVHGGAMYRLASPFEGDSAAFNFVSPDGKQAVLCLCCIKGTPNANRIRIRMAGLDPDADYRDTETGEVFGGDLLMRAGVLWTPNRDYLSRITVFEKLD